MLRPHPLWYDDSATARRQRPGTFWPVCWAVLGFFLCVASAPATVPPGILDPTFHVSLHSSGSVRAVALQPDGKILVGGSFSDFNGSPVQGLARLNADGSVDTSFLPNAGASHNELEAIVVQPDGKILLGGFFNAFDGTARGNIARLNPDGTLDTAFAADTATDSGVEGIALQPDGKILLAGFFQNVGGLTRRGTARLNADGSVDPSFDPGSGPDILNVFDLALQADGKVLIGGGFLNYDGAKHVGFVRLNADGSLDPDYAGSLQPGIGFINAIVLQADGKALVAGDFTTVDGATRNDVARLNADGSVDAGFDPGAGFGGNVTSMAAVPGGGVALVGDSLQTPAMPYARVVRLRADGSLDPTFSTATELVGEQSADVIAAAVQPDGKLLAVGNFVLVNGQPQPSIARFNANGSLDPGFGTGLGAGGGSSGLVEVATLQPDGRILIGGQFSFVDGVPRLFYARLNPDGSLDTSFQPGRGAGTTLPDGARPTINVQVFRVQPDGKILVGGLFDTLDDQPRGNIARLNADGSVDAGFVLPRGTGGTEADHTGVIHSIDLQPDGKVLVGGEFYFAGDQARSSLARLNANGSVDAGFDYDLDFGFGVNAVFVQPDGKVLVGGYFGFDQDTGEASGSGVARLNADGSDDTSFDPGAGVYGYVADVVLQQDGRILLGGYFSMESNVPRGGVARLNADGSLDTSFYPGVGADDYNVQKIALQSDGRLFVRGSFTKFAGAPRAGLVRLNANGSLDYGFDASAGLGNDAGASLLVLALQGDGKVLVGAPGGGVARLDSGAGHPEFFAGEQPVGGDSFYLAFPSGNPFGYYSDDFFPYVYHADLGFEYFIDAGDAAHGAYLYDFASSTFFYTSPSFPFPYLYDFTRSAVLYYYPDPANPGHYTSNPRSFYDFTVGQVITK